MAVSKEKTKDSVICSIIYNHLKEKYGITLQNFHYAALRKRVKDLLSDEPNLWKIARISLAIIDNNSGKFEVSLLSPGTFSYFENRLGVPEEAWKYSLLGELTEGQDQWKIDYWLGFWIDNEGDLEKVKIAKKELAALTKDMI